MNEIKPYVGVTGIMSADEGCSVVALWHEAWKATGRQPTHALMLGALVSEKTLRGKANKYPLRYPPVREIRQLFPCEPGVLNLIHYASDRPPEVDDIFRLHEIGGPNCHGFQFNCAWPDRIDLVTLQGHRRDLRFVLQARIPEERHMNTHVPPLAWHGVATDILLDASGGRGLPLDVAHARRNLDAIYRNWSALADHPVRFGVAGGLCAGTVPGLAPLLPEYAGLSIDAEGRLRDDAPGGGNLDLELVFDLAYGTGAKDEEKRVDALMACLVKREDFGRVIWRAMIVQAVAEGRISAADLASQNLGDWSKLSEDDQHVIVGAAAAAYAIVASDYRQKARKVRVEPPDPPSTSTPTTVET
jgi:hypothetical protein